jgi:hypothetical protein
MRRIGPYRWVLVAVVATIALNLVLPEIGIYAAIALVLVLFAALAEGMAVTFDGYNLHERKGETLARHFRRGRPKWRDTPPDHADEPPELILARMRERRRSLR